MTFDGKQLFSLGVPKNKIKFFIGREFSSSDELLDELKVKEPIVKTETFTWVDWILRTFEPTSLPCKMNGNSPEPMSKSELRRLFDSSSIMVNNKFPKSTDECLDEDFPITSFVWFPKGKRKTTWV